MFTGICPLFFELCSDQAYFQLWLKFGFASEETIKRASKVYEPILLENSNENLESLYTVGFEVAHNLLKLFWRPSSFLQKQVDFYFEKYFRNHYVIGIQLRYK